MTKSKRISILLTILAIIVCTFAGVLFALDISPKNIAADESVAIAKTIDVSNQFVLKLEDCQTAKLNLAEANYQETSTSNQTSQTNGSTTIVEDDGRELALPDIQYLYDTNSRIMFNASKFRDTITDDMNTSLSDITKVHFLGGDSNVSADIELPTDTYPIYATTPSGTHVEVFYTPAYSLGETALAVKPFYPASIKQTIMGSNNFVVSGVTFNFTVTATGSNIIPSDAYYYVTVNSFNGDVTYNVINFSIVEYATPTLLINSVVGHKLSQGVIGGDLIPTDEINAMFFDTVNGKELFICSDFNIIAHSNCESMFQDFTSLKEINFGNFYGGYIENAQYMFKNCSKLNSIDITGAGIGNATIAGKMFAECSSLSEITLSGFAGATDISYMFRNCTSLYELDLSNCWFNNATSTSNIFGGCTNLCRIIAPKSPKTALPLPDISCGASWYEAKGKSVYDGIISANNITSITSSQAEHMVFWGYKLTLITTVGEIIPTDYSVLDSSNSQIAYRIWYSYYNGTFLKPSLDDQKIKFPALSAGASLLGWYTSRTGGTNWDSYTTSGESITLYAHTTTKGYGVLSYNWLGLLPTTDQESKLQGSGQIVEYNLFSFPKNFKILIQSGEPNNYSGGYKYTQVGAKNIDGIQIWETGWTETQPIYAHYSYSTQTLYLQCAGQIYVPTELYYQNETDYFESHGLFGYNWSDNYGNDETIRFTSLQTINLENMNFSQTTNANQLFSYCPTTVQEINFGDFDFSNTNSLSGLFSGLKNLTTINYNGNVSVNTIVSVDSMFRDCSSLVEIDLSKFSLNATYDLDYMFYGCFSLTNIIWTNDSSAPLSFNQATTAIGMFYGCTGLVNNPLDGASFPKCTNFSSIFSGCTNLKNFENVKFGAGLTAASCNYMFNGCTALEYVKFKDDSSSTTFATSSWQYAFQNCSALTEIDMSCIGNVASVATWNTNMFSGCSSLKRIFAPESVVLNGPATGATLPTGNWLLADYDHTLYSETIQTTLNSSSARKILVNGAKVKFYNDESLNELLITKVIAKDEIYGNTSIMNLSEDVLYTYPDINEFALPDVGYEFNGWDNEDSCVEYPWTEVYPDSPGTATEIIWWATQVPQSYTIHFDKQGGSGGLDSIIATYDSELPDVTEPTKTGYTFEGYSGYYTSNMTLWFDGIYNNGVDQATSASATTWKNLTGGVGGTIVGTPTWSGGGLQFSGDDYVATGSTISIGSTTTWEIVFKATALNKFLIDQRINEVGYQPAYLRDTGYLQFYHNTAGSGEVSTEISINSLYTLSIVKNGTSVTVYVNGSSKGTITLSSDAVGDFPLYLGVGHLLTEENLASVFTGTMYSVRIYNEALSASQISGNYTVDLIRFGAGAPAGFSKYYNADGTSDKIWQTPFNSFMVANWTLNRYAISYYDSDGTTSLTSNSGVYYDAFNVLDGTFESYSNGATLSMTAQMGTSNTTTITASTERAKTGTKSMKVSVASAAAGNKRIHNYFSAKQGYSYVYECWIYASTSSITSYFIKTELYGGNYNWKGYSSSSYNIVGEWVHLSVSIPALTSDATFYTFIYIDSNAAATFYVDNMAVMSSQTFGSVAPTSYTVETSSFNVPRPCKPGYVFAGWTGTDLSAASTNVAIAKGSIGNKTYTATWTALTDSISYYDSDGTSSLTTNDNIYVDVLTSIDGTFESYSNGATVSINPQFGSSATVTASTDKAQLGSKSLKVAISGATSSSKRMYASVSVKAGYSYTFECWIYTDSTSISSYKLQTELNGGDYYWSPGAETTCTVIGSWTRLQATTATLTSDATLYMFIYVYSSGAATLYVDNWSAKSNQTFGSVAPTTYTTETASFNLPKPVKPGYVFTGWTGTGLSSATTKVAIAKGSSGTRVYTATWSPITYAISYNLAGGEVATANPTSYTVETTSFTLNNPTKTGYNFAGWTGTGLSSATTTVTITKGSIGDRSYTATWTPKTYTVTYNATENGGTSVNCATGYSATATVSYGSAIDFSTTNRAGVKSGWTFVGWNTNKAATTAQSSGTMGTSDVMLYAIYSKTLTGTFYYGINKASSTTASVTIYNKATSGSITVPSNTANVTYDGRTFSALGWRDDTTAGASEKSAGSSITLTANASFYQVYSGTLTLSYNANGGSSTPTSQTTTQYYNANGSSSEHTFTLANAISQAGYVFNKWASGGVNGTQYAAGGSVKISVNTTFYATWNPNTDTKYKVEHYVMSTSGAYPATATHSEDLVGTTASTLTLANLKDSSYEVANGIAYSYGQVGGTTVTSATIKGDGSLVVKLYYARSSYAITVGKASGDKGINTVTGGGTYYYGASVTIGATLNTGYSFDVWTSSNTNAVANGTTASYSFNMPTSAVTLTASSKANALTFANQTLNSGTYGTAYTSNAFTGASNGTGSYSYAIVSGQPTGATINSGDRKISFTNTTAADTYKVVVRATDSGSGATKDATMTIVIEKLGVAKPTAKTGLVYNGSAQVGVTYQTGIGYTMGGTYSATNAGSYTATATLDANHKWSDGETDVLSINWSIGTLAITITAKAQTITYGGSISTGVSQVTVQTLASGDSLTSITLTASRTTAGTGTITPSAAVIKEGSTEVTDNYQITYNTGTLTINKKTITITGVLATNRIVNGTKTVALAGGTLNDVVSGDSVSFTLGNGTASQSSSGTGIAVTTNITLGGEDKDNYTLTQPTGITVTLSRPAITFNASGGTVNGTTPLYPEYGTKDFYSAATAGTKQSIPTADKTGYIFAGWYSQGTGGTQYTEVSTMKANFNGTAAATWYAQYTPAQTTIELDKTSATLTYGYAQTTIATITAGSGGDKWTYSLSSGADGHFVLSTTSATENAVTLRFATGANVGTYKTTVTATSTYNSTTATTAEITVTVNAKQVAVTWSPTSLSFVYSGAEQKPTGSATGVGSEKINLGYTVVAKSGSSLTGGKSIDAGSYTITASISSVTGGNAKASNYTLTNTSADFAITNAIITQVPSQNGTLTYTGSSQNPSWNNYNSSQLAIGGQTSGTNATTYTATFTPNKNYQWSDAIKTANGLSSTKSAVSVNWSIVQKSATLSISSSAQTLVYGDSVEITITYDGDGTLSATSSHGSLAKVSAISGGKFTITAVAYSTTKPVITVSASKGANFAAPADVSCTITLAKRAITVVSESATKDYDGKALTNHTANITSGTLANFDGVEDVISYTFTGTQTDAGNSQNIFTAKITRSGTDVTAYYSIGTTFGTLTVNQIQLGDLTAEWSTTNLGTATWTAVSSSLVTVTYNVTLYRGSSVVETKTGLTTTAYDFASKIRSTGGGTYTFKVVAASSNTTNVADSSEATSNNLQAVSIVVEAQTGIASVSVNGKGTYVAFNGETGIAISATSSNGYNFANWSSSHSDVSVASATSASTTVSVKSGTTQTEVKITASAQIISYTITYQTDGGSISGTGHTTTFTIVEEITLPSATKVGYGFDKWMVTTANGNWTLNTLYDAQTISAGMYGNVELTAQWSVNSFTLTINPNGGTYEGKTSTTTVTQDFNTQYTLSAPTREGYTFVQWSLSGAGRISGSTYTFGAGDATITAQWNPNIKMQYVVDGYNLQGVDIDGYYGTKAKAKVNPYIALDQTSGTWYGGDSTVSNFAEITSFNASKSYYEVEYTSASSATITIARGNEYNLSALIINGAAVSVSATQTSYTISNVTQTTTILAKFDRKQVSITLDLVQSTVFSGLLNTLPDYTPSVVTADGVVMLDNQSVSKAYGDTTTFVIMPNAGYFVTSIQKPTGEQVSNADTTYSLSVEHKTNGTLSITLQEQDTWLNHADDTWTGEAISTAAQLAKLSKMVLLGETLPEKVILKNDIDLTGYNWFPIGATSSKPFATMFDGDSFTISNMNVLNGTSVGLFGYNNGRVYNTKVSGTATGCQVVAGVVGTNTSTGIVEYVGSSVTVLNKSTLQNTSNLTAGVVGHNSGKVYASYNAGSVTGNWYVGGVVAYNDDIVYHAYNVGSVNNQCQLEFGSDVTDTAYLGGIVAYQTNEASTNFVYNTVSLTSMSASLPFSNFVGNTTLPASVQAYYLDGISSPTNGRDSGRAISSTDFATGTTQAFNRSTYFETWNNADVNGYMADIWEIRAEENNGYPVFVVQKAFVGNLTISATYEDETLAAVAFVKVVTQKGTYNFTLTKGASILISSLKENETISISATSTINHSATPSVSSLLISSVNNQVTIAITATTYDAYYSSKQLTISGVVQAENTVALNAPAEPEQPTQTEPENTANMAAEGAKTIDNLQPEQKAKTDTKNTVKTQTPAAVVDTPKTKQKQYISAPKKSKETH